MVAKIQKPLRSPRAKAVKTPAAALADISLRDDVLCSTAEAARLLGVSQKTLRTWRCERAGPRCLKLGTLKQSRTVYRRSDLEAWVSRNVAEVRGS